MADIKQKRNRVRAVITRYIGMVDKCILNEEHNKLDCIASTLHDKSKHL